MKETKDLFYNRFVNEENLKNINDFLIQRQFRVCSFSMFIFCFCAGAFPTFVGYNFTNPFALVWFGMDMVMYFFLFYFTIKFIRLNKKYNVFNKKWYCWIFSSIFIILSLLMSITAIFTVKFIAGSDESFYIENNPMFFFFLFLPLYIGYLFFCYYAFEKCFAKYVKPQKNK